MTFFLGPSGGLFIATEFDPEEWTPGPYFYAEGFRVAIHEPGTNVHNLNDNGISMSPQLKSEVGLTQQTEYYMVGRDLLYNLQVTQ